MKTTITTIRNVQKNFRINYVKNSHQNFFRSMIVVKFSKIEIRKIYAAKKPIKIWNSTVHKIVISNFNKNFFSKYLIGYSDKDIIYSFDNT